MKTQLWVVAGLEPLDLVVCGLCFKVQCHYQLGYSKQFNFVTTFNNIIKTTSLIPEEQIDEARSRVRRMNIMKQKKKGNEIIWKRSIILYNKVLIPCDIMKQSSIQQACKKNSGYKKLTFNVLLMFIPIPVFTPYLQILYQQILAAVLWGGGAEYLILLDLIVQNSIFVDTLILSTTAVCFVP